MDTQIEALRRHIDIGFAEINMRIVDGRRDACARIDEVRWSLDARITELCRETCDRLRLIEEKLQQSPQGSTMLILEALRAAVDRIACQQGEVLGNLKQIEATFDQAPRDLPR